MTEEPVSNFEVLYLLTEERKQDEFELKYSASEENLSDFQKVLLKASLHIKLSEFENAQDLIIPFLEKESNLQLVERISLLVKLLGTLLFEGGRERVTELINEITQLFDELNILELSTDQSFQLHHLIYGDFLIYSGIYYYFTLGDYRSSNEYLTKALELEERLENPLRISKVLINLSTIEYFGGELTEALRHQYQAKTINDQLNIPDHTAQNYGNISKTYFLRGDYESALYYIEKTIKIFEKIGSFEEINSSKAILANIHFRLGNRQKAYEMYQSSLEARRKNMGKMNLGNYVEDLLDFFIFSTEQNYDTHAIIEEIDEISSNNAGSTFIQLRQKLIHGISLFNSNSMKDILNSQLYFQEVYESPHSDFQATSHSILYLIDLQLLEFRSLRNHSHLESISRIANQFEDWIAGKQASNLEIIALLLQFQICIYKGEFQKAIYYIGESLNQTYNRGLHRLYRLSHYFYDELRKWYQIGKQERDQNVFSLDLVSNTHDLEYFDEFELESSINVDKIFAITPLHEVHHLYGRQTEDILSSFTISEHLTAKNEIYIELLENATLIVNIREFPWIGIISNSVHEELVTQLFAIHDFVNVYAKSNEIENIVEVLNSEDLSRFIEEIFTGDFDLSKDDLIQMGDVSEDHVMDLQRFKIFLHPVRLSIMNIISRYFSIPRARLEKIVGGNRANFTTNLAKLLDERILNSEIQFIEGKPRTVIHLNKNGLALYNEFKETVLEFT